MAVGPARFFVSYYFCSKRLLQLSCPKKEEETLKEERGGVWFVGGVKTDSGARERETLAAAVRGPKCNIEAQESRKQQMIEADRPKKHEGPVS